MMNTLRHLQRITLLTCVLLAAGVPQGICQSTPTPRLGVLIVVDQMRPDYLTKFSPYFTGGLARLYNEGHVFLNAKHNHAHTETGIGHATIATGTYPKTHGIVGNDWFESEAGVRRYCLEDSSMGIAGLSGKTGRSPANMKRASIADWLRRDNPESRTIAVAIKDRAAIPMAGYFANGAYWYNADDGRYYTSLHYTSVYPQWLSEFLDTRPADDYFVGVWDRLLEPGAYKGQGPDSVTAEADGVHTTFPHDFSPGPDEEPKSYYDKLLDTPFGDHLTLRLARLAVSGENLGRDESVDLLMIGCSAADYVGHRYGPDSHEVMDYYVRLDRYLGEFFAFLDSTVGSGSYVVALSSDHGVANFPELLRAQGEDAGRIRPDSFTTLLTKAGDDAGSQLGLKKPVIKKILRGVYLDYEEASGLGISRERLQTTVAEEIRKVWFVADVFTEAEMQSGASGTREYLDQFRNNYFSGRSPEVALRLRKNYFLDSSDNGTTHGTCYHYDCIVPMIFWGAGTGSQIDSTAIEIVDLAPTLAELLGIPLPDGLDGRSLLRRLR